MSRVHEYRAWNAIDKIMYQVGDSFGTKHPLDCCVYAVEGQPVELLQWTGLKDRHGVKIFEGDVVRFNTKDYLYGKHPWEVYFCGSRWDLKYGVKYWDNGDYYRGDDIYWEEAEVIGNKFEHEHLLAGGE